MTEGFDLRALIAEVCDTSRLADPTALAAEVTRRIKPGQRADALAQCLPVFVQHAVSRNRNGSRFSGGGHPTGDAHTATAAAGSPSARVAGIRETWRLILQDRLSVGPTPTDWKFLGDCDVDDLDFAATLREDHARRNAAAAAHLRKLAALLIEHEVKTVADLPESVLATQLGGAQ